MLALLVRRRPAPSAVACGRMLFLQDTLARPGGPARPGQLVQGLRRIHGSSSPTSSAEAAAVDLGLRERAQVETARVEQGAAGVDDLEQARLAELVRPLHGRSGGLGARHHVVAEAVRVATDAWHAACASMTVASSSSAGGLGLLAGSRRAWPRPGRCDREFQFHTGSVDGQARRRRLAGRARGP